MSAPMTAAQLLLACLRTALDARPAPPPADKIMLRAGQEVTPLLGKHTDECCTGLAWVRVAGVRANDRYADRTGIGTCFTHTRTATLEMGVVRCAPSATVNGVPTADQWTATALQVDSDYEAMEAALCCAYGDLNDLGDDVPVIDQYEPLGVDGNCIGGTMTVEVDLSCGCAST